MKLHLQEQRLKGLIHLFALFFFCFLLTVSSFPVSAQTVNVSEPLYKDASLLVTLAPSPSLQPPDTGQNQQAQQAITEAQNDISIANTIITYAGFFFTIISIAAIFAGFLGVQELRRIRKLRTQLKERVKAQEKKLYEYNERFNELHTQFAESIEKTKQMVDDVLHKQNERFETRLQDFDRQIESESQKFIEAAYYYSEGTKAYKADDVHHAIEYYLQAQQFLPKSPRILERLGRAYTYLNDLEHAGRYLEEAFNLDPNYQATLRSLALYYQYIDKQISIDYLSKCLQLNPMAYEALDFLGLMYRDLGRIEEAIEVHTRALKIKQRPETEFYLCILLLLSPTGDKAYARSLAQSACKRIQEQEHDQRLRAVWKILIELSPAVIDGDKITALKCIYRLIDHITTKRLYDTVRSHLSYLLEGAGHKDWLPEFLPLIEPNV